MASTEQISVWDSVLELTKMAQQKGTNPLLWAIQLSSNLNSAGVPLPSVELANVLVSYICWENNVPITWKFLESAMVCEIVPPILVLALLSVRFVSFVNSFFLELVPIFFLDETVFGVIPTVT